MPDFFIGYEPPLPPALSRFVRGRVRLAVAAATAMAAIVAITHQRPEGGIFEYGQPGPVTGRIVAAPYPRLVASGRRATLLVASGKHGADAIAAPLDGRMVTLQGTRIARDGHEMVEITHDVAHHAGVRRSPAAGVAPASPGRKAVRLFGEIVDTKCYLGVMVPGEGHTHAACAAVCLRGGIPPALIVRGARGERTLNLLETMAGDPLREVEPALVGRPVVVTGLTAQRDGWMTLRTDPASWRAVP